MVAEEIDMEILVLRGLVVVVVEAEMVNPELGLLVLEILHQYHHHKEILEGLVLVLAATLTEVEVVEVLPVQV